MTATSHPINRQIPKYSRDGRGDLISTKRVKRRILMKKYNITSGRGWRKLRKWLRAKGRNI